MISEPELTLYMPTLPPLPGPPDPSPHSCSPECSPACDFPVLILKHAGMTTNSQVLFSPIEDRSLAWATDVPGVGRHLGRPTPASSVMGQAFHNFEGLRHTPQANPKGADKEYLFRGLNLKPLYQAASLPFFIFNFETLSKLPS